MSIRKKIPLRRKETVQFMGRGPRELKDRVNRIVAQLKKSDPKHKWSFNAVLIAGLETFIEGIENQES